jgi:hypothetical protein
MKITVSKQAVKEYIKEVMAAPMPGWQSTGDLSTSPAAVSAVVDPSAAATDPGNPNFKPKNRVELHTSLNTMIDDIADDSSSDFFDILQTAINVAKEQEEKDMPKNEDNIEEIVRKTVKKMLIEMIPMRDTGLSYSGPQTGTRARVGMQSCEACDGEGILDNGTDCKACGGKGGIPTGSRKNTMMTDVGGTSFKEIAAEMGYASESGAKQAVEKALEKAQFVGEMDPDELQILVLTTMNDYIEYLRKSGELTGADVELMKSHPTITAELDGFREFLSKALKKSRKSGQKVIDPLEDE